MQLNYNYQGEETPVERLRNKLQPLFFIIERLSSGEDLKDFPEVVKAANESLQDIRDHLSDVQPFFTIKAREQNINHTLK